MLQPLKQPKVVSVDTVCLGWAELERKETGEEGLLPNLLPEVLYFMTKQYRDHNTDMNIIYVI